ncbi:hypothetical protein VNO77_03225 [Canavalia gladiata]|uniref:Uncharacterized protein n=1 Tax=Canavalia gladiata TaxID=3824 RepID=A0AAN9MZZ9_CANGL
MTPKLVIPNVGREEVCHEKGCPSQPSGQNQGAKDQGSNPLEAITPFSEKYPSCKPSGSSLNSQKTELPLQVSKMPKLSL